jgi:hypothetical protein
MFEKVAVPFDFEIAAAEISCSSENEPGNSWW